MYKNLDETVLQYKLLVHIRMTFIKGQVNLNERIDVRCVGYDAARVGFERVCSCCCNHRCGP